MKMVTAVASVGQVCVDQGNSWPTNLPDNVNAKHVRHEHTANKNARSC